MLTHVKAIVGLLSLSLAVLTGCPKSASVKCSDITKAQSQLGVLNLPQLRLGTLLWLDSANHRARRIYTVVPDPADVLPPTPTIDATSLITKYDFDISVQADVPQTVQADLKTYIRANTEYELKQHSRTDIQNPVGTLNKFEAAKVQAATVPATDVLIFISGIVNAQGLRLKLKDETGVEAGAHLVKFGDYEFKVTYDCENSVQQAAQAGSSLLWKGLSVAYDPATRTFRPDTKPYDLKDYDFMETMQ